MSTPNKSVIVGTAGHIDHGKSSLVQALTGTHPDRLEEEKRRGITIDLGFAFLQDGGVQLGFVDVPGHERFVSNMLAGAGGIDLVLLVIAADEGVKPQTREHVDICRLLGLRRGVVALTKSDLVDADTLALMEMEIADYLRDTFLESAPVMPVSVRTQAGVAELRAALLAAAGEIESKDAGRFFRLPIDRAFAMKGFGTVVTGKLISGSVAVGEEVELFPGRQRLRVRGVQSAGSAVARAVAGQRTAINLAGIDHGDVRRGMALAAPGRFAATRCMDVKLTLLESAGKLKQRSKAHLYSGTFEGIADVILLGQSSLAAAGSAPAQIRLAAGALVLQGDHFILRQLSPVATIGGGVVLDPLAKRITARDTGRVAFLGVLERGGKLEVLAAMVERAPMGLGFAEIAARTGWMDAEIRGATQQLVAQKKVTVISAEPLMQVAARVVEEARKNIAQKVERFRAENPLAPGIAREELRASLGRRVRAETFRVALEDLLTRGVLEVRGDIVKKAGTEIALQPEEAKAKEQIVAAFAAAGLAVPGLKEVLGKLAVESKRAEKLLQILLREKTLVRVNPELIFHGVALAHLKAQLSTYKKEKSERISVPAFKDLAGVSRKYAIPLLEYLDRERVTRRAGEERVIL